MADDIEQSDPLRVTPEDIRSGPERTWQIARIRIDIVLAGETTEVSAREFVQSVIGHLEPEIETFPVAHDFNPDTPARLIAWAKVPVGPDAQVERYLRMKRERKGEVPRFG